MEIKRQYEEQMNSFEFYVDDGFEVQREKYNKFKILDDEII